MKLAYAIASAMLVTGISGSASAQSDKKQIEISVRPVIEAIHVEGVPETTRQAVMERIGLKVGDDFPAEARQRLGKQLASIGKDLTFSYTQGTKFGTVKLRIGPC